VKLALNNVSEEWKVFFQSVLVRDKLPKWDSMWSNLQQEELRQAMLKSFINSSNNNGSKVVKEEENVAFTLKGPSQGNGG